MFSKSEFAEMVSLTNSLNCTCIPLACFKTWTQHAGMTLCADTLKLQLGINYEIHKLEWSPHCCSCVLSSPGAIPPSLIWSATPLSRRSHRGSVAVVGRSCSSGTRTGPSGCCTIVVWRPLHLSRLAGEETGGAADFGP